MASGVGSWFYGATQTFVIASDLLLYSGRDQSVLVDRGAARVCWRLLTNTPVSRPSARPEAVKEKRAEHGPDGR
jgi:hypothetical protein